MSSWGSEEMHSVDRHSSQPFFYISITPGESSLKPLQRDFGQTLRSNESPTFRAQQSAFPLPSHRSSTLSQPPIHVSVRSSLRPPSNQLPVIPVLKAIRSQSTLNIRKNEAIREVERFKHGRNMLNRLVSSTDRLVKQGKELFERKNYVSAARNWAKTKGNQREMHYQSYLKSLFFQGKVQKQQSSLNLEHQKYLSSQYARELKQEVLRKREVRKQMLTVRNVDLGVKQPQGRTISEEEVRYLLQGRTNELFR